MTSNVSSPGEVWLFASNAANFDAEEAFTTQDEIWWSETTNAHVQLGDTVFLYATKPTQALTHQCIVTETGLPDGKSSWTNKAARKARVHKTWMALQLVRVLDSNERRLLGLSAMENAGLPGPVRGRRRASQGILDLLGQVLLAPTTPPVEDSAAERYPTEKLLVRKFADRMDQGDYSVSDLETSSPDRYANQKTRGSAQRAFANRVKSDYGYACALTGINTPHFLVASHIVPWSEDHTIRLDPTNGICLSTLVDRAFEDGYLRIAPDGVVHVNHSKVGADQALAQELMPYDGVKLRKPTKFPPNPKWLQRRWNAGAKSSIHPGP
ncbi:HNH endonuclease [Paeniglutamicibacter kerguelensis]|uniref:HNH nuclease domain-containing protein n=1 Tax=Paeniglutamicibacter kerguelensis TaxID=254788 RepID=A0ABS4XI02_9MICC|nr:HNH endonuclease signature motif containing protein [Paeniglutamicibacter kerguelensis]MBP2387941.1 hypothetical protein [Paeniglutamicibacter kerguelensis]